MQDPLIKPDFQPVFLSKLRLTDFRNYCAMNVELKASHVILTGENGSGKTNLLEAVSYLSPGRGLRRAAYDQIARAGGNGSWSIFAELEGASGPVSIGTGLLETAAGIDTSRKVRINGSPTKTIDELLDHSRVIWLTPSMDGLFSGPASDRRKFIDRMVLAIDPLHGRRVSDFEKAMRGRNRLLSEDTTPAAWLDAIEGQMAELGTAIAAARCELVSLLANAIIDQHDDNSPFPDAVVILQGGLENKHGDMASSDLEEEYANRLRTNRRIDKAAGRTLEGPHRSDILVRHRPKSMNAALCSTGEQKALLIGIILAHAHLTREINNFPPILLLDEIAAHLDAARRASLFDLIDKLGCQAFMTGTDRALFDAIGERGQFFSVAHGTVSEG